jgi:hypothetical protein
MLGTRYWHSLGLKADGSIVAWGDNDAGQCNVPSPNTGFVAVAGGFEHSLGLKTHGSIVAWGWNDYGQCDVPSPNMRFVAIAAGEVHGLAVRAGEDCNGNGIADMQDLADCDGSPWCRDCNANGLLDACDRVTGDDFDADGTVDADDLAALTQALAGPDAAPSVPVPECLSLYIDAFDADADGNLDLRDFAAFQAAFTGP